MDVQKQFNDLPWNRKLQVIRAIKDWGLKEAANEIGVSLSTMHYLEKTGHAVSKKRAEIISNVFGLPLEQIPSKKCIADYPTRRAYEKTVSDLCEICGKTPAYRNNINGQVVCSSHYKHLIRYGKIREIQHTADTCSVCGIEKSKYNKQFNLVEGVTYCNRHYLENYRKGYVRPIPSEMITDPEKYKEFIRGVYLHKSSGLWLAKLSRQCLGYRKTWLEAAKLRLTKEIERDSNQSA